MVADPTFSRQAALADFGARALSTSDLDELLLEACSQLAKGCDADFSKFVDIEPGSERLVVRTAVNMLPGTVGTILPAHDKSAPGYAIDTGQPVVTADVTTEERFEICTVVQ